MPIGRIISAKHFVVSVSLVPLAAVRRTSVTVGTFVGLANVACCLQWTYPVTREEYEELASNWRRCGIVRTPTSFLARTGPMPLTKPLLR